MTRLFMSILAVWLFAPDLFAQFGNSTESIARERRAMREKAVEHAGAVARAIVESEYGDEAARALLKCTPETATRIAEFYASGGLPKLAHPKELLCIIANQRSSDEVANWIVGHPAELVDQDAVDAFIEEPITFVVSLKKLSTAAAERKAARETEKKGSEKKPEEPRWSFPTVSESTIKGAGALGLMIGVTAVLIWWKRRRRGWDSAA